MMTSTMLWCALGLIVLTAAVQTFMHKWNALRQKDSVIIVDGETVNIECKEEKKEEVTEFWMPKDTVYVRV